MNIPGKPAVWIGVVVAVFMAMFLLPGDVTWLLVLVVAPAAMFAAVITAYQEAARFRAAEHPAEPAVGVPDLDPTHD
ncbi:hypothetical protein OHA77_07760 [Streptosporangium sp. NBC_01639]|uniref:hypothetical protein n=1 Tax=Streptosporangium sp. NBC_01639 TaxID=2975948 RepID=UPI00386A85FD|nr:hypothetical protein OHA77_07760 [Streptosporangium sp. NBC_01639]